MHLFDLRPDYLVSKKKKTKEELAQLRELGANAKLEKGDLLALILAASVTLLPIVIIILLVYYGISMLLFG